MSATATSPFRVHFANGEKIVVQATTAEQARKIASGHQLGPITKIKLVRA